MFHCGSFIFLYIEEFSGQLQVFSLVVALYIAAIFVCLGEGSELRVYLLSHLGQAHSPSFFTIFFHTGKYLEIVNNGYFVGVGLMVILLELH